jgi:hypothetical protein
VKQKNYRQIYEEFHGKIPDNHEIHHKIPKRMGGTDELDNLVSLTRKENSVAHLELYKLYGDKRDLFAHYMLSGEIKMGRDVAASIGGKIGGKKTADNGLGIHGAGAEQRSEWGSLGGKIGGNIQVGLGLGIHTSNTNLRLEWASKGGLAGPFGNNLFQAEQGKKGGKKNLGSVWITTGEKTIKYTAIMQQEVPIDIFLGNNPKFRRGRK